MSGFFSRSSSRRRYPDPNMGGRHYRKKGLSESGLSKPAWLPADSAGRTGDISDKYPGGRTGGLPEVRRICSGRR